ncbi:MAG: hypothetical protein R3B54_13610 [Bdellovibrionota bacterium]
MGGLKSVTFYLRVDNNTLDNEVVADLWAGPAHRAIRRQEFHSPNEFQEFSVYVHVPPGSEFGAGVYWQQRAVLEVLGVRYEGVAGSQTFLASWDYPTHDAGYETENASWRVGNVTTPTVVSRGLQVNGLAAGAHTAAFTLLANGSLTENLPMVRLEVWKTLNGSDVAKVAERVLTGGDLFAGAISARNYLLDFSATANSVYDLRVAIVDGFQQGTFYHYATTVIPKVPLGSPVEGPFKHAGRYFHASLGAGSFCRYLSFDELRTQVPTLANDLSLPVLTQLPRISGAGLCTLRAVDGAAFRVARTVPVLGQYTITRYDFYLSDAYKNEYRRCDSNIDLEGTYGIPVNARDPRLIGTVPLLTHYPDRLGAGGMVKNSEYGCTGNPVPQLPETSSCIGAGPGTYCADVPGVTFKYLDDAFSGPSGADGVCTNLRYFGYSIYDFLCTPNSINASWRINLEVLPSNLYFEYNSTVNILPMNLPANSWCVELLDNIYPIRSDIQDQARGYYCVPGNPGNPPVMAYTLASEYSQPGVPREDYPWFFPFFTD